VGHMGVCRFCDEYSWITDRRGYCADCVDTNPGAKAHISGDISGQIAVGDGNVQIQTVVLSAVDEDAVLTEYATALGTLCAKEEKLKLIQDRMAEYVLSTDIPLQLVKEERRLIQQITALRHQLSLEGGPPNAAT